MKEVSCLFWVICMSTRRGYKMKHGQHTSATSLKKMTFITLGIIVANSYSESYGTSWDSSQFMIKWWMSPICMGKKYTKVREELVGEIKEFSGVWGQLDKVLGN